MNYLKQSYSTITKMTNTSLVTNLVQKLIKQNLQPLNLETHKKLLKEAGDPLQNYETNTSGDIKVWKMEKKYLIEEFDSRSKNYWVRTMENQEQIKKFVKNRLETYENQWNGCGCRVHYSDIFED
ncbi:hypothetical protein M0813_11088 [Anaeramoeba flamelloides]|uniref:Thiol oxidase n=1 Tax=Anaeramoeba flamelloides TaxID=1746091 RepID=A0ABQ8ZFU4_9EUKA|nr:hypothetical protein M0813_11088 [Anaeramoeba flamelloides]